MKRNAQAALTSTGGVIALFVALLAINLAIVPFNPGIDLTQGRLHTLAEGTRAVLSKLEAPVQVRLYFSQGDEMPVALKAFGRRVEDLLASFRRAADGRITVERLDPQPDSDAEDKAALDGIQAQTMPNGERFYLGIAVGTAERRLALPAIAPDRERLLEYDLTRAIARAGAAKRKVIGVMSPLPLFGSPGSPMMGMPPQEPLVFIGELRRDFELRRIAVDAEKIDSDVDVLLVVHPRGVGDGAQYAIDQFVMRGGRLIALLDAHAYFDQIAGGMMQMAGGTSSNLEKLLKAWGIGFDSGKVVMDLKYATGSGQRLMPTLLTLTGPALDSGDVATFQIGSVMLPFSGVFSGKAAEGLTQSVLMKTSTESMLVDSFTAMTQGEAAIKSYAASGKEHPLAIRLAGGFRSAFPEGRPVPPPKKDEPKAARGAKAAKAARAAKAEPPVELPAHIAEAKPGAAVALVADSDFINDDAAVAIQEMFGQRVIVPRNGNIAFAQALVEQFAGDANLIGLRSRAVSARPLTVIREMEARAAQRYIGKIKALENNLSQSQEKLQALQKGGAAKAGAALSAEQQAEVEKFRRAAIETRRELKEVRKELRADSEALQFWTRVANIAPVPMLVAIAGLLLAVWRRRRRVAV